MERITSRQNAIVKRFRDLAHGGHTAEILLDGEHLVEEALACGIPIDIAAFSDTRLDGLHSPLARLAREVETHGARVLTVADSVLSAMSPVQQPSGVVAIAQARPVELSAIMDAASDRRLVIVLAGLQDPGNVGAIVRAAAAFGAAGVVTIEGSANPFGWKALRGAMGGTFRVPVAVRGTLAEVIAAAREHHVRLIAAVARDGTSLPKLDLRRPTAIILGGEGAGLADATIGAVDETVTIPMQGPIESLNVAIAAALILYEAARQRQA